MSWGAAGAITAFSILGAWSVGGLYLPAALMLAIVLLTSDLRNRRPVLQHLGVFLFAGMAQAALILFIARLPALGTASQMLAWAFQNAGR